MKIFSLRSKYSMKKLIAGMLIFFLASLNANSAILNGGISQSETKTYNKVIDKTTKLPVSNAKVIIPSLNYTTYSNQNGEFELNIPIYQPTFISVEKQNYKPFSMTISNHSSKKRLVLAIEKSNMFDVKIDSNMCHLGDNNFSDLSEPR